MNIGFAAATTLEIADAKGRPAVLTYLRCPLGCAGLILKLNGLPPIHLGSFVLAQLCEALRAGRAWSELQPSPSAPGVQVCVIKRPDGNEHFMLGYVESEPDLAYFMATSAAPSEAGFRNAMVLDPSFRRELADRFTAELVADRSTEVRA